MEKTTKALLALLDTIGDIRPIDARTEAVDECVQLGDAFLRVADLVKDTVDGMILFFVESQHCRSVGGLMQRWEVLDDYTVNTIADAMPEDERSVIIILKALSRFVILTTKSLVLVSNLACRCAWGDGCCRLR